MSLSDITRVVVPRACVDHVHAHLRAVGQDGHEGMGLWVGRQSGLSGQDFVVTQSVIPEQQHIRTPDGVCVCVGAGELHRLNVWLFRNKVTLLAQIHSHPGRAYHSSTDDENAVATAVGCLSLVVPDFARAPFSLPRTAIYRLDQGARWRAVDATAAGRLIEMVD